MTTIWKYKLKLALVQSVELPLGATILTVQMQHGDPFLWAKVDSMMHNTQLRFIALAGTGHPLLDGDSYISTCQDAQFVWHWFETFEAK